MTIGIAWLLFIIATTIIKLAHWVDGQKKSLLYTIISLVAVVFQVWLIIKCWNIPW